MSPLNYKAVLVESDSHLLEVMRYIHRNPLQADIVNSLGDFQWSSHQGYLSRAKKWEWLHQENLLAMLASAKGKQRSAYMDFVSKGESEEIRKFYSLKNLPSILGGNRFKEFVRDRFSDLSSQSEIPEAKILVADADKVIGAVMQYYRVSLQELLISRRGNENLARDMAVYLVRNLCRMTLPEVGQKFGITNYSSVSSIVQRMKSRMETDKRIAKEVRKLLEEVDKGQKQT